MTWKVRDEYKDTIIFADMNALSEKDLKIVKETIPEIIEKYLEEI
jgi:hypothetical protein